MQENGQGAMSGGQMVLALLDSALLDIDLLGIEAALCLPAGVWRIADVEAALRVVHLDAGLHGGPTARGPILREARQVDILEDAGATGRVLRIAR